MKSALSLCFFSLLTFLARCYNFGFVFLGGQYYFTDGDCYSRMTRVRMVLQHPFTVIHHQDFENYPQGISSHATAPFDYLIAFLALVLKPFTRNYLDLAGALVSPLLGVAIVVFLWDWSRRANLPHRGIMLLLFAISPIIVHGTVLGRPDHQSLQMLCVAVALGAEWCFAQKPSRGWGIASGAAWAMGLWVSLYEPLVLLVVTMVLYLIFDRRKLWVRERREGHAVFAGIIVLMLLIDGIPFSPPDKMLLEYFPRWEKTIGELASINIRDLLGFLPSLHPVLYGWVGFGLLMSPALFFLRSRDDKRAIAAFMMVSVVFGLTLWQSRWGYFFALVFAMSLPCQFAVFRKPWIAWSVFIASLVPVWWGWQDGMVGANARAQLIDRTRDALYLRDASKYLKGDATMPILAPWWFSPALAYWSAQPAVAGTSHESMPGIIDSSRFYLTADDSEAKQILGNRRVHWVVAYDPGRVLSAASVLLNQPASDTSLGYILFTRPHSAPDFVQIYYDNAVFKVFKTDLEDSNQ